MRKNLEEELKKTTIAAIAALALTSPRYAIGRSRGRLKPEG
jgi:hypothetical protein